MEEKEIWRDVKGYENIYQVSNLGRVKSLERVVNGRWGKYSVKSKLLTNYVSKSGYNVVSLSKDGKVAYKKVHRLVANAFIPNPNNFPQVNHKDEVKTNNTVILNEDGSVDFDKSNLEWCTITYNLNYGSRSIKAAKTNSKKVYQYTIDGVLVKVWDSLKDVVKGGFNNRGVGQVATRKRKTSGGYIWKYEN